MDEVYDHKDNCYGCNACLNICPTKAITTHTDEEGFLYPVINKDKCIQCGRCTGTCPIILDKNEQSEHIQKDNSKQNKSIQKVYAVKHKEEATRLLSTSGGMFTAISDYILELGGIVYGAAFDENLRVCHHRAISKEQRDELRGSKYVQSDIGNSFVSLQKDLLAGSYVLFTGTPCQIAGLKKYLKNDNVTKLILCDIVCHGVPSDLMWKEYKQLVQRKKEAIKIHYFRTKVNGWHSMTSRNVLCSGKVDDTSILSQLHMTLFLSDLILRPCCYHCKFATFHRISDITIADFWGVDRSLPDFDDNKGVSLVLTNTQKGEELFTAVKEKLVIRASDAGNCLQRNLQEATILPLQRKAFWKDYQEYGYEFIAKKYANYNLNDRMKSVVFNQLKRIKKAIK